ncbi:hypothetical protein BASA83_007657 [Batrachochytrium salamandrivorans]|nr:hypothetical protein BASA83_007657 [Batrachochytrium salamandrivorans]
MDPSKISAVQSWPTPKKVGTCKFVRIYKLLPCSNPRLLQHDSNLTKLFKKDAPFVWGPEQEKSLQDLKTAFANSDFHSSDDSRPFIGDRCIGLCDIRCSQSVRRLNTLRPIAFYARQMNSADKTMKSTTKSCWLLSSHLNIGGISSKVVSILSRLM